MSNIGQRIKTRRIEIGMTQEELAVKLGYKSRSSVNKIETGNHNLTQSKIKLIADILGTTPSYIMGWDGEPDIGECSIIPVLGSVVAGIPLEGVQDITGYVEVSGDTSNTFALSVHGDSMEPEMHDGDTVIIKRMQNYKNGDIVVARVNGYDYTVKKYHKDRESVMLIPVNSNFSPMIYDNNTIAIEGKVVQVRRDYA